MAGTLPSSGDPCFRLFMRRYRTNFSGGRTNQRKATRQKQRVERNHVPARAQDMGSMPGLFGAAWRAPTESAETMSGPARWTMRQTTDPTMTMPKPKRTALGADRNRIRAWGFDRASAWGVVMGFLRVTPSKSFHAACSGFFKRAFTGSGTETAASRIRCQSHQIR